MRIASDASRRRLLHIRTVAGWLLEFAALITFSAAMSATPSAPKISPDTQRMISLLRGLEKLEVDAGVYSPAAIPSLMELSNLYVDEDKCPEALFMLKRATDLTRINYGLFNADQMEMSELIKECDVKLRLSGDFQREQRYSLLLAEHLYGRDDPRSLPTLKRTALWYEEAGWYLSARALYIRAASIVRRTGGEMDLRLVDPLRGIARTRRLAAERGLADDDVMIEAGRSAFVDRMWRKAATTLDRLGQSSLEQAVRILRAQPTTERGELIDTLLDLGDWYQSGQSWRDAMQVYKDALRESIAAGNAQRLFGEPMPVAYRMEDIGVTLHRPPAQLDRYAPYWMAFDFTVTPEGKVKNLKVVDADVSETYRQTMTRAFGNTVFRPRFSQGEPVETQHVSSRQTLYVKSWARVKKGAPAA